MAFSRRHFFRRTSAGLLGLPLASALAPLGAAAEVAPPGSGRPAGLPPLNRFPRTLQDWAVARFREVEARGDQARRALTDRGSAEAYVSAARRRIAKCFGSFPSKTALNPRVTGRVAGNGFNLEKILFESRPNFLVTANLYLPTGRTGPLPTVLGLCGHWPDSKADAANHQSMAQGLALQGYVCLVIDPVGQGERRQYFDAPGHTLLRFGVPEHLQMGNQQILVGETLAAWFAWDAMRAIDYLATRPEVDLSRLGVTGCSGGGTQTAWVAALDSRVTMMAPACFVTTMRRNVENELPVDPEQCPPGALGRGLDHSDFIAAFAPRPAILLAQEHDDIFDVRGTVTAYERLKSLYTLLGHPENIALHIGPDHHGYSRSCREAMYRWFNRACGRPSLDAEPAISPLPVAALQCTPGGQVANLQSRTVMSFTADAARRWRADRPALQGEPLIQAVRHTLRLPPLPAAPPDYRILRDAGPRAYPSPEATTYAVETEPGLLVSLTGLFAEPHLSRLPQRTAEAVLYVSHHSADVELREEGLIRELQAAQPSAALYACDLRGIGDSQPNTCGANQFFLPYGSHYFYAALGQMLDRPLLGQRTFDLLRVIQLLERTGHTHIHLAGRGWGALPATFAALLCPSVHRVTLKHALRSYLEVAETEGYRWPCALLLPGVLRTFDLPDCYAALAAKPLTHLEPWGPRDGLS